MGKDDRDEVARRELKHALEALGDGAGAKQWGPGPVINRLSKRNAMACEAFEMATMVTHDLFCLVKREDAVPAIRRLAPVFLEMLLERQDASFVFDRQLARERRGTAELRAQIIEQTQLDPSFETKFMKQYLSAYTPPMGYVHPMASILGKLSNSY